MTHQIYLDYAAATPISEEVLSAMEPFFSSNFYNPSSMYLAGRSARTALDDARASVAKNLGVRTSEIIFTAGGTEANNLAIAGIMNRYENAQLAILEIEHDSIIQPANKYDHRLIAVETNGLVDMTSLHGAINDTTVLVSIGLVNNEIGTIQSLKAVKEYIDDVRRERLALGNTLPLYLHTDACQAGNYLSLQVNKLGVDLMTINGGKIYGPKQSGALYVKAGITLEPVIYGGGQESGLRSGTENVAASVGLSVALTRAQKTSNSGQQQMQSLQHYFIKKLLLQHPQAIINGSQKNRIANNVHVTFPGQDNERLMMALDESGVQCAVGSACSASSDEPSHVLKAIGLSDSAAQSSLRFTMGRETSKDHLDRLLQLLNRLLA